MLNSRVQTSRGESIRHVLGGWKEYEGAEERERNFTNRSTPFEVALFLHFATTLWLIENTHELCSLGREKDLLLRSGMALFGKLGREIVLCEHYFGFYKSQI